MVKLFVLASWFMSTSRSVHESALLSVGQTLWNASDLSNQSIMAENRKSPILASLGIVIDRLHSQRPRSV